MNEMKYLSKCKKTFNPRDSSPGFLHCLYHMFLLSPEVICGFSRLSIKLFRDPFSGPQAVKQSLVLLHQVERLQVLLDVPTEMNAESCPQCLEL